MPISIVKNMDCMEFMRELPDKHFSLVVTDPPYGIKQDGHRENHTRSKLAISKKYHNALWLQNRPSKEYFTELQRVSKNQIIWGANHFADLFNTQSSCWIVWNKKVMSGKGNHFADCELAFSSFPTAVRSFEYEWQGMIQGNMANKERRIHPTQKPVALYKWLLQNYAKVGDTIFDSHLGSGSSRIAAYDLGFDFYATELDKDYYEAQEKRFAEHLKQPKLFEPVQPKQELLFETF